MMAKDPKAPEVPSSDMDADTYSKDVFKKQSNNGQAGSGPMIMGSDPENEQAKIESPGGPKGGLGDFLFQFLKANPDLAREMSTRMNAVINGQKLQGLKGAAPGGSPPPAQPGIPVSGPVQNMGIRGEAGSQPPMQMAGDVLPMPGERSMGPGETPAAAGFATGQQTAPNVQSIGTSTLQQWLQNVKARQG